MAVGWGTPRDGDAEPVAPTTPYIFAGYGVDPASPGTVATAWRELAPVPYAPPDELQPGVIEPAAVLRPTGKTMYTVQSYEEWTSDEEAQD